MAESIGGAELAQVLGTEEGLSVTVRRGTPLEKTFALRPLTLAQIARALVVLDRLSDKGLAEITKEFNPVKLLLRGGEDALELLSIATGGAADYLGGLDAADGARLFAGAVKVNEDFFSLHRDEILSALGPTWGHARALAGQIKAEAVEMLAQVLVRVGQSLSSGSSAPGTESKMSEGTR